MSQERIKGIPEWLKVVEFRPAKAGEWIMTSVGPEKNDYNFRHAISFILAPDNVYNVYDLAEVKIPEGYRRVEKDWFREPKGEDYIKAPWRNGCTEYAVESTSSGPNFGLNRDIEDRRRIIVEK